MSGLRPPRRNVTDERELRGHVARVVRVAIGVDRGLTATSCRRCPSTSAAWSNPKFRDQDQGLTQPLAPALGPQPRTASRTEPLPRSHVTGSPARRTAHRFVARASTEPGAVHPSSPATTAQNAGPERRRREPDTLGYRRVRDSRQVFGVCTRSTNTATDVLQSNPGLPGQSGIHTGMTNTRNTPIEALERTFPLRVLRYRLRRGSGGAGRAPGGEGIERDLQVLEVCTVSLITERRVSRPWGLWGGEPGAPGENWLLPQGDEERAERLPDKCTIRLQSGDVLRMLTPGGGGWGPPPINSRGLGR
ncbi:MAG: hydantoinase B/oxoprolinase family protein [Acidimicrobiales bacterium]